MRIYTYFTTRQSLYVKQRDPYEENFVIYARKQNGKHLITGYGLLERNRHLPHRYMHIGQARNFCEQD